MAVSKKPKWKPGLVTEPGLPDVAVAVSLGLRLLQEAGCSTWAELVGDDPQYREKAMSKVTLSPVQAALLDRHTEALTWIAKKPKPEGGTVTSTICVCPSCGEFTIVTGAAPSSCKINKTCRDAVETADAEEKKALKPVKVKAATRQKTPEDPLNEPADIAPVVIATPPAPATDVAPVVDGRAEAEVTRDGLVRAKAVVFGDVVEDEFFEDTPAPSPAPPVEPVLDPVTVAAPVAQDVMDAPVDPSDVTEDF